jgi:hypothetical protein
MDGYGLPKRSDTGRFASCRVQQLTRNLGSEFVTLDTLVVHRRHFCVFTTKRDVDDS